MTGIMAISRSRTAAAAVGYGALLMTGTSFAASSPIIQTAQGEIIGTQLPGTPAINAFLGVPYAAPPTGNLRLRPPQPHASWTIPLQATDVRLPCPQASPVTGAVVGSEDCLYLNVYVPASPALAPRPVMVFIPGGGFTAGSASSPYYNGQAIAEQSGVIVVTVTYRIGPLGFLTAPALDAESAQGVSGNYGLEDQQAALRWVNRNIVSFGGNPLNVTLFGESAGANSTEYQLVSPLAAHLFQKDIIESSIGLPLIPDLTLAQSESGGSAGVITQVGCSTAPNITACLRALPASDFVITRPGPSPTYPVVDGYVLPETPPAAFASGRFNQVLTIIGSNLNEFTSLISGLDPNAFSETLTAAGYAAIVDNLFGQVSSAVLAQYPANAYQSPLQALAAVGTDAFVACQTEAKRQSLSHYVATFGYEFAEPNPAEGPILGPPIPNYTYGDYHTSELPYVFGYTAPTGAPVVGKDVSLSRTIIAYWTNFATANVPDGSNLGSNPIWPSYEAEGNLVSLKDQSALLPVVQFDTEHHCGFWAAP